MITNPNDEYQNVKFNKNSVFVSSKKFLTSSSIYGIDKELPLMSLMFSVFTKSTISFLLNIVYPNSNSISNLELSTLDNSNVTTFCCDSKFLLLLS